MMGNDDFGALLSGDDLRDRLVALLPRVQHHGTIISAFVTRPAVDLLFENISERASLEIICRLQPHDVQSGATDLLALRVAIQNGATVSFNLGLHAKIYLFDDDILYSGSANFTSSGLRIQGWGNIESSTRVEVTSQNIGFVRTICETATPLSLEMIDAMEQHLNDRDDVDVHDEWPLDIIPENDGLWVSDFFLGAPHGSVSDESVQHDLQILKIQDFDQPFEVIRGAIKQTRCIRWLQDTLVDAEEHEAYFGSLSAALHRDLLDDPAPYRRDVKTLLQNMTAYCERYLSDEIEVTRPRYSQRFRLLTSH